MMEQLFFEGQCKREQSQACLNSSECSLNSIFYQLVRVAIGSQETLSCSPSKAEWKELYAMAKKQSLVGICFAGLQKLYYFDNQEPSTHNPQPDSTQEPKPQNHTQEITHNPEPITQNLDEVHYLTWMGTAAQINMKNEIVNEQCVELQKRLATDGLRSCVLKGQGVAALYGEELRGFRQSGDIDLWMDGGAPAVIKFVSKYQEIDKLDNKHLHFHCFEDTEVELHWSPSLWFGSPKNPIMQAYFDNERERQFAYRSNGLCVPTFDFQLVHQLLHVYNHYVYEGVGLRQMMDLYFAQLACANCPEGSVERAKYGEVLGLFRRLGLLRFVAATQWVLQEVFGMSEDVLLCAPDAREGRKLLDEIMIGGNFGHHDERNHVAGESLMRRFLRRWGRKFRMFRFDPLGTLLMPLSRLKLELWMRRVRRKYNV